MQGRNLYCINHSYVYHDTPELKKLLRVSPFRLYYFMRGKITFAKELYNAKELFLFSFFVPIYFTWYLLRGFSGKSKISCFRAVFCGALDALFNKYDKRYLQLNIDPGASMFIPTLYRNIRSSSTSLNLTTFWQSCKRTPSVRLEDIF